LWIKLLRLRISRRYYGLVLSLPDHGNLDRDSPWKTRFSTTGSITTETQEVRVIPSLLSNCLYKGSRICLRLAAGFAVLSSVGALAAHAATLCVNPGGTSGCKKTINAAVGAASPGDTILVAPGTYKEDVVITRPVALLGSYRASVIDASGLANGIFVNGMSAAPKIGITNVTISGFTVRNANFEGILIANATDVSLTGNLVTDNDKALNIGAGTCAGINTGFETNEQDDCGEGVHLMGTYHVSVVDNEVAYNSGGILTSDETGPSQGNLISGNNVHDNPYDCGITLASHGAATSLIPTAGLPYGVSGNTIAHNISAHNGYQVPGAGAGVGIFAPGPGNANTGNVVIDNDLRDNGATGVAMHNHAAPAMAPPVNMNDNVVIGNHFSGNGPDNPGAPTSGPTGINVFSQAPISGTVISQNEFDQEAIDVAFTAPVGQMNVHLNDFNRNAVGVQESGIPTATTTPTVDATENWWNCAFGPGSKGACATVTGNGVATSPWLTAPYDLDDQNAHPRFR
jgi:nitrous oxidase accessory protein NosD